MVYLMQISLYLPTMADVLNYMQMSHSALIAISSLKVNPRDLYEELSHHRRLFDFRKYENSRKIHEFMLYQYLWHIINLYQIRSTRHFRLNKTVFRVTRTKPNKKSDCPFRTFLVVSRRV
ncbi:hypothetical protein EIN_108710 [Entamoeba invadens IP1]|uniref:Uncharacterized protein n=1 Tax=Entamoeba invadens IP1 TaxID=370355 RepID=L7FPD8_ENTIV|nr:hypothetical protein EIN_108710 [Entamoeba invadens IP1]ELP94699.1 hypothetical protein EIN_108710 [Entamoeba invadens IP1]|eukprot:XP_004261470.1 hypothetical protein EIN_108710 [Entamoeba invadens IP1]